MPLQTQAANLLLETEPVDLPLFGLPSQLRLLAIEFLFPRDQPGGLRLDFLLAPDGPLLQPALLVGQALVLTAKLRSQRREFLLPLGQLRVGQPIILGKPGADLPERPRQGGRRRRAGQLHPEFLGGKADLQRRAVRPQQFRPELLQGHPALIDLFGPPGQRRAPLGQLGLLAAVLGGEPLLLVAGAPIQFAAVLEEFLAQPVGLATRLVQLESRLATLLLPTANRFSRLARVVSLPTTTLGRVLGGGQSRQTSLDFRLLPGELRVSLVQLGLPFGKPQPGASGVIVQLGGPGVQLGLAMVQVSLPRAQVIRQLRGLRPELLCRGDALGRQLARHSRGGDPGRLRLAA